MLRSNSKSLRNHVVSPEEEQEAQLSPRDCAMRCVSCLSINITTVNNSFCP